MKLSILNRKTGKVETTEQVSRVYPYFQNAEFKGFGFIINGTKLELTIDEMIEKLHWTGAELYENSLDTTLESQEPAPDLQPRIFVSFPQRKNISISWTCC